MRSIRANGVEVVRFSLTSGLLLARACAPPPRERHPGVNGWDILSLLFGALVLRAALVVNADQKGLNEGIVRVGHFRAVLNATSCFGLSQTSVATADRRSRIHALWPPHRRPIALRNGGPADAGSAECGKD